MYDIILCKAKYPCKWEMVNFLLKTLFNIVKAQFKNKKYFDVCVVRWCSEFGPINSQEYIGSHYQDIYDWISPLNKPSDLWFILTAVYGGNEYGKSGHLSIFTSLKNFVAFEVQFFRASFVYPIKDTDNM